MAKVQKEAMYLVSTEETGHFYTYRRNKKKQRGDKKISIRKYDPIARKHALYEEKKSPPKLKRKYRREEAAAGSAS